MSLEVNIQESSSESEKRSLTKEEEGIVVRKLNELWTLGTEARSKQQKRKNKLVKAYEAKHEDIILKRNGSKAYLPWVYTAHESAQARLSNSLLPNDEDVFLFEGETEDDQPGCDMMADYIKYVMKEMGFQSIFDDAIKEVLFGEVVMKLYWRKDIKRYTGMQIQHNPDGFGGSIPSIVPTTQEEIVYNSIYTDVIPSEDFSMYPVTGDLSRATIAHRVWRHKDELMAVQEQGAYINVDLIEGEGDTYGRGLDNTREDQSDHEGFEVREFWIPRIKVGERVFKNMIATVVAERYLVRFEPNPYDYDLTPFIYCPLIKDQGKNTGHALTDRAFEIQKMANFIVNQVFDESKIKLFGFYKYTEDGVFRPASFVARAGALVKVGDINNIQPVNPNINQLSFGLTELEYLENQFETTTGIPKFLTGTGDYKPNETATAKRLQAEGADTRFRALARRINEYLLKPFIKMSYALIRQNAMQDIEVLMHIARVTQRTRVTEQVPVTNPDGSPMVNPDGSPVMQEKTRELSPQEILEQMPTIPPLGSIDVKIVGFENVLDKADKANQLERFFMGVGQLSQMDPGVAQRVDTGEGVKAYAHSLSVNDNLIKDNQQLITEQLLLRQGYEAGLQEAMNQQQMLPQAA